MYSPPGSGNYLSLKTPNQSWGTGGGAIVFKPNNTEYMRVTPSGNVGIGTDAPANTLHVNGETRFGGWVKFMHNDDSTLAGYVGSGNDLGFGDANDLVIRGNDSIKFTSNNGQSDAMTIDVNGKVGIGTTSPVSVLNISSAGIADPTPTYSTASGSIYLHNSSGGTTNSTVGVFGWQSSAGIGAGVGFARENSSDWGSQIRFYVHPTATSNLPNLTEAMRITAAGNVGIGTNAPGGLLDLATTVSTAKPDALRISNAGYPAYYWDMWRDNSTGHFNLGSASGGSFTTHITVKEDGNVGIGTSAPAYALDVVGYTKASLGIKVGGGSAGNSTNPAITVGSVNTAGVYFVSSGVGLGSGSSTKKLFLNSSGSVGIGTESPGSYAGVGANLEVKASGHGGIAINSGTASLGMLAFAQNGTHKWSLECQNNATPYLSFNEAGTQRLTIDNGGNVGIGTTSPSGVGHRLVHIKDTSSPYSAELKIEGGYSTGIYVENGDARTRFYNSHGSHASYGGFLFEIGSVSAKAGTPVMRILSNGNVGIGTTTPGQKLHVNGNIIVNGQIITPGGSNLALNPNTGLVTVGGTLQASGAGTSSFAGPLTVSGDVTAYKAGSTKRFYVKNTDASKIGTFFADTAAVKITAEGSYPLLIHTPGTLTLNSGGSAALTLDGSQNATFSGTITENSSIALKENIFDLNTTLDKINRVRPVKYNKKVSKDKKEIGFIAEELAEIFPELVENDENGNPTSVNYTRAVTVLFDGFKQMYKELKEIKEKIK
jgi:hypothetical protein